MLSADDFDMTFGRHMLHTSAVDSTDASAPLGRMFLLVANRNFRLMFSAAAVSNLGDGISALAFPWLATLITRDPVLIALVAFATRLPWLLFAIPVGVITDRFDRRRLMVQADVLRLLLVMGVIGLILSFPGLPMGQGDETLYILALSGLAFFLGSAEVVRDNASQTALPSIVEPGALERANGQLWSIEQIMGAFLGPPLAGVLIAMAVPAPFALSAVTFGLAAWIMWCLAMPAWAAPTQRGIWREMAEGARWVLAHKVIFQLAVMLGLLNAASILAVTVLILVSQEILGLSAVGHGLLLIAGAAGGVVGGLLCPGIVTRVGRQNSLRLALALFPVPLAMIAVTSSVWIVAVALFLEMFAALLWNVVTVSYRQRLIPDALLGRVNSIYRFFGWGMMPFGALLGGVIVASAEPSFGRETALRVPYIVAALGMIGVAGYGWLRLRLD